MKSGLNESFVGMVIRLKKLDFYNPAAPCMPPGELMIMTRAATGGSSPEKGVSVYDIHQSLHLSKPALSQALNALEKKGYITRSIDPDDRRKITVTITPAGEAELKKSECAYNETLDAVLDEFGAENTKQLIRLCEQLMDIIESERN